MKIQGYEPYDYCKSIECYAFDKSKEKCDLECCIKDAKQFHKWLIKNKYIIIKGVEEHETTRI